MTSQDELADPVEADGSVKEAEHAQGAEQVEGAEPAEGAEQADGAGGAEGDGARRRRDSPVLFFALVAAVPLLLVTVLVGVSALPPYHPSQAEARPYPLYPPPPSSAPATPATPGVRPANTINVYEAENTALGTAARRRAVAGASGGSVVTRTGYRAPAGDVTFRGVVVPATGSYMLTVYYLLPDRAATHRLGMSVDEGRTVVLRFPPQRAPGHIAWIRLVVTLYAGTDTVRFSNAGRTYGPDLDRITVQPLAGSPAP